MAKLILRHRRRRHTRFQRRRAAAPLGVAPPQEVFVVGQARDQPVEDHPFGLRLTAAHNSPLLAHDFTPAACDLFERRRSLSKVYSRPRDPPLHAEVSIAGGEHKSRFCASWRYQVRYTWRDLFGSQFVWSRRPAQHPRGRYWRDGVDADTI